MPKGRQHFLFQSTMELSICTISTAQKNPACCFLLWINKMGNTPVHYKRIYYTWQYPNYVRPIFSLLFTGCKTWAQLWQSTNTTNTRFVCRMWLCRAKPLELKSSDFGPFFATIINCLSPQLDIFFFFLFLKLTIIVSELLNFHIKSKPLLQTGRQKKD